MRRFLLGVFLVLLVAGTWAIYRVGYARGFVSAQRIGYQRQVNDVMSALLSRQRMLGEPSAARCELEGLVRSQLDLLAIEENGLQRGMTWRDVLQDLGEVEEHARAISVPTVDQIRSKFNVRDDGPQC